MKAHQMFKWLTERKTQDYTKRWQQHVAKLREEMMEDQMRWDAELKRLGAKSLIIKPDGEIIPIY